MKNGSATVKKIHEEKPIICDEETELEARDHGKPPTPCILSQF